MSRVLSKTPPEGAFRGNHLSRTYVAARLKQPTRIRTLRTRDRTHYPTMAYSVWPCSEWGLPSRARHRARWWSLTPPFHPYRSEPRRFTFCGTGLRVTPSGCYPPSCAVEPGLSSKHVCLAIARTARFTQPIIRTPLEVAISAGSLAGTRGGVQQEHADLSQQRCLA